VLRDFGRYRLGESHTYFRANKVEGVQKETSELHLICPYSDPKKDCLTPPQRRTKANLNPSWSRRIFWGLVDFPMGIVKRWELGQCGEEMSRHEQRRRKIDLELSFVGSKPRSLPHADRWGAEKREGVQVIYPFLHTCRVSTVQSVHEP
jgi:hypothetical protein